VEKITFKKQTLTISDSRSIGSGDITLPDIVSSGDPVVGAVKMIKFKKTTDS